MLKKVFIFILFLALSTTSYISAENNTPKNVRLEGNSEGIVFIPEDETFLLKERMIPGDSVSGNIIIDNKYDVEYEIFMRAERVSKKEKYDLLNKLELIVSYKDNVIYNGPASGEDGLSKNISLGKFKPGEEANLHAEVNLDGHSTGNEYKNKYAQVDWIFTAVNEEKDNPSAKPDISTKPDTPNTEPDTSIKPNIPSTEPNNSTTNSPNTGDNSTIIYIIVGTGALIVLCRDKFKKIVKKRRI